MKQLLTTVLLLLIFGSADISAQMSPEVKRFLVRQNFSTLLHKYKQDHISLRREGTKAEVIAAQPYTVERGFRCQTFASSQLANARQAAAELRARNLDSVYVVEEGGLFKVQVGNFAERKSAETLRDRLKIAGINSAWVVEADVHKPKSPEKVAAYGARKAADELNRQNFYYAVQIIAMNDSSTARQLRASLQQELKQPVQLVQSSNLWKVLVGQFADRNEAEVFLRSMKNTVYSDAWITQFMAN